MLRRRIDQISSILSIFKPTELKIKIAQFLLTFLVITVLIILVKDIFIGTLVGVLGSCLLMNLLYFILCLYCENETLNDANGMLRPGDESVPFRMLRIWDCIAGYGPDRILNRATIGPEFNPNNSVDDVFSTSLGDGDVENVDLGNRAIGAVWVDREQM